jgi:subtilisin family serine protease
MSEISFSLSNKQFTLKKDPNIVVVKHKTPVTIKKTFDVISTKSSANVERSNVQTIPSVNLSLVTRPIGEELSITRNFTKSLSEDEDVEFIAPAYKDKETGTLLFITNRINVGFKEGVDKQTIDKILSEHDLSIVNQDGRHYVLKVNNIDDSDRTIEMSEKLFSMQDVIEYADPIEAQEFKKYSLQIPIGQYFREQWHLHNTGQAGGTANEDVKALDAWKITKGKPNITIACIDDGCSWSHPNINFWKNPDPQASDQYGYDFYDDDPDPAPKYFNPPFTDHNKNDIHGTPCAGVICAKGESESGVHGIAPECKIIAVKIFGSRIGTSPITGIPSLARAIRYAGRYADVLSCSWGGAVFNPTISSVMREIATSGRNGKGCPIFCATGNDSELGLQPVSFPANLAETIAVGASTNNGRRAPYSNVGREIDFVAPSSGGTKRIFTTDVPDENRGFNIGASGQGDPEGFYTNSFGGTSSATPLAAGIGALLLSINPDLTADQVRQILRETCDKIDPTNANYDSNGFSKSHGYGRVNAKSAVEKAKEMV